MADSEHPEQSSPLGERLQRVLAAAGVASRRKSEELIRAGRVTVNGRVVTELGTRVDPMRSAISVDGKAIKRRRPVYYMLNKPSGYITTTQDERGRRTVMELVPDEPGLFPVGRLDRETEGLLLLTTDGDVANRVMHPRYGLTKEYHILTPVKPPEAAMQRVRDGLLIDGKLVRPDGFRIVRETPRGVLLSIILHEGMNRVVRRLMEKAGIAVSHLRRERIGPLALTGIPKGHYRELTSGELRTLFESLGISPEPVPARMRPSTRSSGPRRGPRKGHGGSQRASEHSGG